MAVYNNLPAPAGLNLEPIWTNLNPNVSMTSALDIAIDWNTYSRIFCKLKYAADSAYVQELVEMKHDQGFAGKITTLNFSRPEPNSAGSITIAYRQYQINSNGIRFLATAGYTNTNSNDRATNSIFCIPVEIYGVR